MSDLSQNQLDAIRSELDARGKIAAIKLYRSWMRCSLMEAKNAVESIEREGKLPEPVGSPSGSIDDRELRQVDEAIARGNKLEAIKLYRQFTGRSLMESKDFVETRMNDAVDSSHPSSAPSAIHSKRSGCFSSLLLLVTLATGSAAALLLQL